MGPAPRRWNMRAGFRFSGDPSLNGPVEQVASLMMLRRKARLRTFFAAAWQSPCRAAPNSNVWEINGLRSIHRSRRVPLTRPGYAGVSSGHGGWWLVAGGWGPPGDLRIG